MSDNTRPASVIGVAVIALFATGFLIGPAAAQTGPKAEEAMALVKKAVAHIEAVGETKAFEDFTKLREDWVKGEYYIFCHTLDGVSVAHGGNPALVGKNVLGFKDPDGVAVNLRIIEKVKAEGQGWVEYRWPNPVTKKVEPKVIYSEAIHGAYVCGSGYYK